MKVLIMAIVVSLIIVIWFWFNIIIPTYNINKQQKEETLEFLQSLEFKEKDCEYFLEEADKILFTKESKADGIKVSNLLKRYEICLSEKKINKLEK